MTPTCKDCKFYKPKDENTGDCLGYEVLAKMSAEKCPAKSFQPAHPEKRRK
jgi:hypothetical protein